MHHLERYAPDGRNPPRRTFVTHGGAGRGRCAAPPYEEELGWPVIIPEHAESVELG
jgi:hypothetical protein